MAIQGAEGQKRRVRSRESSGKGSAAGARLQHPNIVCLLGVVTDQPPEHDLQLLPTQVACTSSWSCARRIRTWAAQAATAR